MTFFKSNNKNTPYHPFIEFLIITISLIVILVPLRIFSREIFADEWIGSLGMISIVFGAILFLSKKEKLGKFGEMFLRQIVKNHKGKKKVIIYFQTGRDSSESKNNSKSPKLGVGSIEPVNLTLSFKPVESACSLIQDMSSSPWPFSTPKTYSFIHF